MHTQISPNALYKPKNILFNFVFIFPVPGSNQVLPMASDCFVSPNLALGLLSLYIPGNTQHAVYLWGRIIKGIENDLILSTSKFEEFS